MNNGAFEILRDKQGDERNMLSFFQDVALQQLFVGSCCN